MHRIFLIPWQRPAPLQEFLVPNHDDWTAPRILVTVSVVAVVSKNTVRLGGYR
jgi:hypothetical protein